MDKIQYQQLAPEHFNGVITLGNHVHGDNYLDEQSLLALYQASFEASINASFVALWRDNIIGFRLTQAAANWQTDKWCSPDLWGVPKEYLCYFKCNTVDPDHQAKGIGSTLLALSIGQAQRQGAKAGLAHIWLASPGNSAFRYFSKCGGKLVKEHAGKWRDLSIYQGYDCPVCADICDCVAAEMILTFTDTSVVSR